MTDPTWVGILAIVLFVGPMIVRNLWRKTKVTMPDGSQITRADQIYWRKQRFAVQKAWEEYYRKQGY